MKMKFSLLKNLFVVILFLSIGKTFGQFEKEFFAVDSSAPAPQYIKYGLKFNSLAFFKNNEYFHPLVEGYTLPGFQLQPRVYFQAGDKFSVEAGVHLAQYSGKKGLNSIEPLFRATYNPTPAFSILLGWIKGTQYHQLIEPLYQWEKVYTHPLEYGVQFLVNKDKFTLDTWIDWERYIELNDPFQEELTFGTNSCIRLLQSDNFAVGIPLQITVKHQGGQITAGGDPLKTLANWATGFKSSFQTNQSFLSKVNFDFYYVGFSDLSPQKRLIFKNGFGIYPIMSAEMKDFNLTAGYWYGYQFIASKGEPLFLSASATNPSAIYPNRQVVTFKSSFRKQIYRTISFSAYAEAYYDAKISQIDYAYGINMAVSGDIFIKKQ